jgi:HTH-type transcriptional regulator, transcriptional repressor of NAD biosynthesis genes
LLLDAAQAHCDRLIVLLLDYAEQTVAPEIRAAWLRQIHPGIDVRIIPDDPTIAAEQTDEEAAWIRAFLGDTQIDVFFSSEHYGEALAHALGALHYDVDRERFMVPVTGTMVRRNPASMLQWLEPPVRAYYVPRVCIAGAESTGKTTLCEELAQRYGTPYVPEYGRTYTLEKVRLGRLGEWAPDEFVHIAFEQQRQEDDYARRAFPLLLCDTDAFATRIWYEFYLGDVPEQWPLPLSRIDLYLLPYPDVPFVADEIREGEHRRYWMHARFEEQLAKEQRQFVVLSGTHDERVAQAVAAIDALVADN